MFLHGFEKHGLTHFGRVTHICVGQLTTIGSDNGLSPGRRQTVIWNNAGILLIRPVGTNFSEILIGIQTFSFKKMHLEMASAKWRPFCFGLNVSSYLKSIKMKTTELLVLARRDLCVWWLCPATTPSGRTSRCFREYSPKARNFIWIPTANQDETTYI